MWIETTSEVYNAIYFEHKKSFSVFGSFTDIDGAAQFGNGSPMVLTEWGFKDSEHPIIKSEGTKEYVSDEEYEYKYFIHSVKY